MQESRTKSQIRLEAKALRAAMHDVKNELLGALLRSQIAAWLQSIGIQDRTMFLFAALKGEPDLLPLLHEVHGVHVALPRILNKTTMEFRRHRQGDVLIPGPLGIREPDQSKEVVLPGPRDVIFVPALALSRSGQRIGHGAGYYDRYLASHPGATLVGVCYQESLYDARAWPDEAHDRGVQFIATDQQIVKSAPTV